MCMVKQFLPMAFNAAFRCLLLALVVPCALASSGGNVDTAIAMIVSQERLDRDGYGKVKEESTAEWVMKKESVNNGSGGGGGGGSGDGGVVIVMSLARCCYIPLPGSVATRPPHFEGLS